MTVLIMSNISVLQVISNGNIGFPKDMVVQIGITEVDTDSHEISRGDLITVRSDIGKWTQSERDYISSFLTEDQLENGISQDDAVKKLRSMLKGKDVTSFEVRNTFSRYLVFEPWDLTYDVDILPSVSIRIPNNLRGRVVSDENSSIEKAYSALVKGTVPEKKDALTYARMTSELLLYLHDRGLY